MAGAGFKTFNTGDVLTAADVNTYLMQQTVMVFASAAARTTALGANVAEGMLSYLKDTNSTEYYTGSVWTALAAGGGITQLATGSLSGTDVTISSISQSYKSLLLVLNNVSTSTSNSDFGLRCNGITSNTYNSFGVKGDSTNGAGNTGDFLSSMWSLTGGASGVDSAGTKNVSIIDFPNYTNSSTYITGNFITTYLTHSTALVRTVEGALAQTNEGAISSLTIRSLQTFDAGTYTLFGVS